MNTREQPAPTSRHQEPCPCGCAPCDDTQCELECNIRPRFFCGQLLTDDDMSSVVTWAAQKSRLQRFTKGWGVACGLHVRCDPTNPRGVVITTGYGIDCCGEDIVLCHDAHLDLSDACKQQDPCEEPPMRRRMTSPTPAKSDEQDKSAEDLVEYVASRLDDPQDTSTHEALAPRWVDVVIKYAERHADPRATLRHSECADPPECEAARVEETVELGFLQGAAPPGLAEEQRWCRGYEQCIRVLDHLVDGNQQTEAWRKRVLDWLSNHPPQVFCGLRDEICWLDNTVLDERRLEILTKIVLDCRISYARQPCHSCEATTGVRLARVHLGQVAEGAPCRVLRIDAFPPYRRPLTRPALPAKLGHLNLAGLIGGTVEDACSTLTRLGVSWQTSETNLARLGSPSDLSALMDCGCDPIVKCGSTVTIKVLHLPSEDRALVVGMCLEENHHEVARRAAPATGRPSGRPRKTQPRGKT